MDGSRLKEIRKDHGDTQDSLAAKLGFSTPTIRKWEQGISEPNLDTVCRICRMYEVTADYLLGLTDDDPLIYQRRQSRLTPSQRKALQLFESFLLTQDDDEEAERNDADSI